MRHDVTAAGPRAARSTASAAVMFPGTPRAGSRPLIGRNSTSNGSGPSSLGQTVVGQAVSAMIQPEPLGLDDVPQIKMTAPRHPVEPLVGRGDGPHPEPGPLDDLARVDPEQPIGRQADCRGVVHQPPAARARASGEAASSSGSVPGSRWSECLWLARTRSTVSQVGPAQRSAGHPDVRPGGPLVLPREVLGEVGIDHQHPAVGLIRRLILRFGGSIGEYRVSP